MWAEHIIKCHSVILLFWFGLSFIANFDDLKLKPFCSSSACVTEPSWNAETWKTKKKNKKKHGVEMLMWRGRNPVILTVDIKGDRPESSQFKTRTWVQSVLLLFSWPWPIITHRHSTGWITIRLGLEIGLLEAVLLYLTSFKLKYWRAWSSSK